MATTRRIEKKATKFTKGTTNVDYAKPTSTFKRPSPGSEVSHEIDAPAKSTKNLTRFKKSKLVY